MTTRVVNRSSGPFFCRHELNISGMEMGTALIAPLEVTHPVHISSTTGTPPVFVYCALETP
jgi:hypothetical protein